MQTVKQLVPHGVRVGRTITRISLVVTAFSIASFIIAYRSVDAGTLIVLITLVFSLGLCGLISGPIITVTKRREAPDIDEIHAGRNVLAHWTYAPDEWGRFIEQELARARKYFVLVLIPITLILLAVKCSGSTRSSLRSGGSPLSFAVVLIVIGIVAVLLWIGLYAPILAARKRGTGDVYITSRGVLLNDRYYSWMTLGAGGPPSVSYKSGGLPTIQFDWVISMGTKRNFKEVRVPVPREHEQEAHQLVSYFQGLERPS